jgi:hypothetical protein
LVRCRIAGCAVFPERLFAACIVNSTNKFSRYYALRAGRPRRHALSRNDKIAIVGSALLLLAILAAGGFGLSMAYHYNEPASDVDAKQP